MRYRMHGYLCTREQWASLANCFDAMSLVRKGVGMYYIMLVWVAYGYMHTALTVPHALCFVSHDGCVCRELVGQQPNTSM